MAAAADSATISLAPPDSALHSSPGSCRNASSGATQCAVECMSGPFSFSCSLRLNANAKRTRNAQENENEFSGSRPAANKRQSARQFQKGDHLLSFNVRESPREERRRVGLAFESARVD